MKALYLLPILALSGTTLVGCSGSSGSSSSPSASPGSTAAATAPASNGEETKPAEQVRKDAQAALVAAKAVHVAGTLNETLQSGKTQSIKLDLQLQGNDTAGTITEGTVALNLVVVGGKAFIKTGTEGLQSSGLTAAQAAKLANRWIALTAIPSIASQFTQTNVAEALGSSKAPLLPTVSATTYEGQKAVSLSSQGGSTLVVRDTGAPVPLALEGSTEGGISFTGYDQPQNLTAPPGAVTAQQAATGG